MEIANLETEYKFQVAGARHLTALRALNSLAGHTMKAKGCKQVTDVYFDTPGMELANAGFALRARHGQKGTLLGLKSVGTSDAGLHVRGETEEPGDAASCISKLPAGKIRTLLLEQIGENSLQRLITLHQKRELFDVEGSSEILAELSLDEVSFGDGPKPTYFSVELEAKSQSGNDELRRMAQELRERFSLREEPRNKLEVALGIERLKALACAGISAGDSRGTAHFFARKVLARQAFRLHLEEERLLANPSRAHLRNFAVQARRVKVALRVLASAFEPEMILDFSRHLKALVEASRSSLRDDGEPSRGNSLQESPFTVLASSSHSRFRRLTCVLALAEEWGARLPETDSR